MRGSRIKLVEKYIRGSRIKLVEKYIIGVLGLNL